MPTMPGTFRPKHQPTREEQRRDYDRRRGSARARGYDARWDREAKAFKFDHPLCLGCHAVGRIRATEVVDHTIPHKGDVSLFWDMTNRQPACQWHHDVVKQKLERLFDAGKIDALQLRLDSGTAIRLTREMDPSL